MAMVKICGLKDAETVASVVRMPVDLIGFLFAASKRQVTPEQAGALVRIVRERRETGHRVPLTVGVFVDPTMELLAETLKAAPLDAVQLHGAESPAFCRAVRETFGIRVYRVFSVSESASAADDDARTNAVAEALDPYAGCIDGLLLDTAGGGTGRTFEWSRIPHYAQWARRAGVPLFVAGGLTPDNVAGLIEAYRPDGVDVSSGVETNGAKDITKIRDFVERVKGHESHAGA
ncbi:phosphoribosylanthranilate isomerase [Paenibacillus sp. GYB003]|uniref:phosphoribosylanthranilate isomerase n=1 Tax=Paenibacillus sp. GYB003 TaxID=2994392 RepID=UPI002F964CDA